MTDDTLPHDLRLSIGRLARRLRAQKADDSISDSQFSVLASLQWHGDCTIGSLSESEKVTPPSMNRTVNALEAAGYVARASAPDDGRKVVVSLTAAGRDLVQQTALQRDAWFVERLRALDPAQRAALEAAAPVIKELAES
ncbi:MULTISPECIES: MarR family transcriptional regulator [unclassified Diaminobutyricimonas]|uniref:MarR family winged helix-turn-helix transcriptional regulator n=1 Tax=unclassified Diaminobutyricimonas TaxID=2643261 RepID=UPI0012F4865A|nr:MULTISPECIES: MarR family transcriptional regulator [unclassified Diaminobutyricimonas]